MIVTKAVIIPATDGVDETRVVELTNTISDAALNTV